MLYLRPNRQVQRVMDELGFDQMTAERHVSQLHQLQQRLREQTRQQVREAVDNLRPLLGGRQA